MACVSTSFDCNVISNNVYQERILTSCTQIGVTCVKGTRMELKQTSCVSFLQQSTVGPQWVSCTSSAVPAGRCCTTNNG